MTPKLLEHFKARSVELFSQFLLFKLKFLAFALKYYKIRVSLLYGLMLIV